MSGRGAYGRPWFPAQVAHYLRHGRKLQAPSMAEQSEVLLSHYRGILSHYGKEVGARVARKHVGWYCNGLSGAKEFCALINRMDDPDAVMNEIANFYSPLEDYEAA